MGNISEIVFVLCLISRPIVTNVAGLFEAQVSNEFVLCPSRFHGTVPFSHWPVSDTGLAD